MNDEVQMEKLKIVKYPWHTGHDYELCKLPHDLFFLSSTSREWAWQQRPFPKNAKWTPSLEAQDSDVMILHLDQWSYQEPSKRALFEWHRDQYSGKKIIILHGSQTNDGMTPEQLKQMVQDNTVVCNSKSSLETWDLPQARFIRHGMSAEEWPKSDHSLNNVIVVQAFQSRHKEVRNLQGVKAAERKVPITWVGRDIKLQTFGEYKNFLSKSSIFFNPSFTSANPRSRTEAMLCGLAIVTTNANGEDEYIENGINGYCSNDMDELIHYLDVLKKDRELAKGVGTRGRETAQGLFGIDQFIGQWNSLLSDVCVREAL